MALAITTIASSSAGNCYLIDNGKSQLLVECGIPWARIRKALGFRTSLLAGILLTHEHGDHSRGAKDAAKSAVNIYCTAGTAAAMGLTGHRIHHLEPLVYANVDGWQVMAFPTFHDAADPCGFLICSGHDKLLFMTDSIKCPVSVRGLTYLMVECNYSTEIIDWVLRAGTIDLDRYRRVIGSHMSIDGVIQLLEQTDRSRLQEIHLIHLSDGNSDEQLFKSEIQKIAGIPVYVAKR